MDYPCAMTTQGVSTTAIGMSAREDEWLVRWGADPVAVRLADEALEYHATRHPFLKWIDRIFR